MPGTGTIILHVVTIGHHGAYVGIALTPEGAAAAFAAEAAEYGDTDIAAAYPMTFTVPRGSAHDAVRYLLSGYGGEHVEAVWSGIARGLAAAT